MSLKWSISFIFFCLPLINFAQTTNTDESKVPNFDLPQILTSTTGQKIKSVQTWEKIRRPELLKIFAEEVYGKVPANEIIVSTKEKILNTKALGGKATLKEITFVFSNQSLTQEAILLLFLPNNATQSVPVFLGYNFDGNHTVFPNEAISIPLGWVMSNSKFGIKDHQATPLSRGAKYARWPVLNIINRGYGLAVMHYGDIDPDFDDDFKNGVHQLINKQPKTDEWGSIATWAWGLSKVMDYFEKEKSISHDKVAVIGHSRLGKTALWAGAVDQRFAMIISNDSGCGGAALSKRKFGETIKVINDRFPHWFCDNFTKYNGKEEEMPFDQHLLIALMAPRPVYIASAKDDSWADPKGEFLSGKYASPAYELYNLKGIANTEQPPINQPIKTGHIGYHIRTGKHDLTIYDWEQYLDFADLHFR